MMHDYYDDHFHDSLLGDSEERILLERYQKYGDQEALQKLVHSNLGLVLQSAHNYKKKYSLPTGVSFDDLIQENVLILMGAIKSFDMNSDTRLSTYVTASMNRTIFRKVNNIGYSVYIPYVTRKNYSKYKTALESLQQNKDTVVSDEVIMKATGFGRDGMRIMKDADRVNLVSLNCVLTDSTRNKSDSFQYELEDSISQPGDDFSEWEKNRDTLLLMKGLYELLDRRSYYIIYYDIISGVSKKQVEIAKELEISKQKVFYLRTKALKKIAPFVQKIQKETFQKYGYDITDIEELKPISPKLRFALYHYKQELAAEDYATLYHSVSTSFLDDCDHTIRGTLEKTDYFCDETRSYESIDEVNSKYRNGLEAEDILYLDVSPNTDLDYTNRNQTVKEPVFQKKR